MNEVATIEQPVARLPALHAGGAVRAIVPQDFDSAWRIANAICKAGMAPRGLESAEKATVAILHGLEVGLTPMNALQSIAVINSRATIWGDGALGLVQASGKMASHKEWYEGDGDARKAICVVTRKGDPEPKRGEFSVTDAKKAGLWGKSGPWSQYSDRMLKMRARAFALRDGFSDVLRGLGIAEEVQDIAPAQTQDEPPAPPPVAQDAPTIAHQPERQPEQARAEAVAEVPLVPGAPNPASDPEAFIQFVRAKFKEASDGDALVLAWETYVEPAKPSLFPPDEDDLMSAYRKREHELS